MGNMWKMWLVFDPRRMVIAFCAMATLSSLTLHFVMLSTTTFDFLEFKGEVATAPLEIER